MFGVGDEGVKLMSAGAWDARGVQDCHQWRGQGMGRPRKGRPNSLPARGREGKVGRVTAYLSGDKRSWWAKAKCRRVESGLTFQGKGEVGRPGWSSRFEGG